MSDKFLKKLIDNQFVYHYTSIDAVLAILEGYRQKKNFGLPFRAHCIYNVNDPREMKLGFDAVKKFLPEYERKIDNSMYLSEVYLDEKNENRCREECYKKPSDGFIEWGHVPYTSSFSSKGDFLPMWSVYGAKFKGVCLKFRTSELVRYLVGNYQFGFVTYNGDEDDSILKDTFINIYKWVDETSEETMTIDEKISELSLLCTCISPFVKSSDWAYEQEFRIVYNWNNNPDMDMDEDDIEIILKNGIEKKRVEQYKYYPIYPNALEEIIIGPKANYNVVEHILRNELKECLLNDVKISPSSIEIL